MTTFEPERLKALHFTGLLDSAASPSCERLTEVAAEFFGVPIVLVSLVDKDRQYFLCALGLSVQETHRDDSFCAHALHTPEVLVVLDAVTDPRFSENALVLGPPHIRFYAGAPIHSSDGHCLGTLCLLDDKPRVSFSVRKQKLLTRCAALASALLADMPQALAQRDGNRPATRHVESCGLIGVIAEEQRNSTEQRPDAL